MESFIEKGFFMMNLIHYFHPFSFHPCPCGRKFCHVNLDFILHDKIFQEYYTHTHTLTQ